MSRSAPPGQPPSERDGRILGAGQLATFFLLVFALSAPLWLIGVGFDGELLPGLPISALMTFCPAGAATIVCYRQGSVAGVKTLWARAIDAGRVGLTVWWIPILFIMPVTMALSYLAMRGVGQTLPEWQVTTTSIPVLTLLFLFAALGEELGWTGLALPPMQARFGAAGASVVLGLVWAIWHVVPLLQAHRTPSWIGWWTLATVAARIFMVWLYNNAGRSVFAAAVFHASINLTWQLFPNAGSHYDPRFAAPILAATALAIVLYCGPATLVRPHSARSAGSGHLH
ncbi:type II CAAX endopeptidase family protein [Rhizobium sp. 60-20]|uniref:CPBP family intramembrane glutamic endopeptidase n=1 Tax=Rhizobium sp. 60-20 TaxID=1895819 RepID=UPI0009278E7A|nr:type II CAAX endopeptidase family protein [Rhizobium sp. 60-20]MBN8949859.1 CPBP family intramembrane metalloprotease [Rhizobium tropici]OJY62759.1 MAG: hypothetical protein BGP09_16905 [Rhizobium sp. 60-20]